MSEPKPLASLSSSLLARKGHAKPAMRPQGFGSFGNGFGAADDLGWNDMGHDRPHPAPVGPFSKPVIAPVPAVVRQREELAEELNGFARIAEPVADPVVAEEMVEEVDEDFAAAYEEAGEEPETEHVNGEPVDLIEDELVEDEVVKNDTGGELVFSESLEDAAYEKPLALEPVETEVIDEPAAVGEPIEEPVAVVKSVAVAPVSETPVSVPAAQPVRPVAVARAKAAVGQRTSKAAFTLRLDAERHLRLRLACAITNESAQMIVQTALDQYLNTFPELDDLARIAPAKGVQ